MTAGNGLDTAPDVATQRARIIGELNELVAALDRRVPHVGRVGEVRIARAVAALRSEAWPRIAELQRDAGGQT